MAEWQPIETAPRDSTTVLLWESLDDGDPAICVSIGSWEPSIGFWIDFGWETVYPTHWMPLPSPPEEV
jgi:hypothetical protein